jgi:hypothetical protein
MLDERTSLLPSVLLFFCAVACTGNHTGAPLKRADVDCAVKDAEGKLGNMRLGYVWSSMREGQPKIQPGEHGSWICHTR